MSTRYDLPSGGWIELKDIADLRARDKRSVQRAVAKDDPDHPYASYLDIGDLTIQTVTISGFLPYAPNVTIPASTDWLDELTLDDLDHLDDLIVPLSKAMYRPKVSSDDHADPDSPTAPESE